MRYAGERERERLCVCVVIGTERALSPCLVCVRAGSVRVVCARIPHTHARARAHTRIHTHTHAEREREREIPK